MKQTWVFFQGEPSISKRELAGVWGKIVTTATFQSYDIDGISMLLTSGGGSKLSFEDIDNVK